MGQRSGPHAQRTFKFERWYLDGDLQSGALLAIAVIVFLTAPSYSQEHGGKRHHGREQKSDAPKKKPDDKAYIGAIQDADQRY